jgi:hypothetical protein
VEQAETETLGGRLRDAIASSHGSERAFLRALETSQPRIRRRSRNTVRRFLRNEAVPPDGWLERVAKITGVRLAWLTRHEGGKTEADEVARRVRLDRPPQSADQLTWMLKTSIHDWPALDDLARAAVVETWRALAAGEDPDEIVEEHGQAVLTRGLLIARRLGEALAFPLAHLTWRSLEGATHWNAYVTGVAIPYRPPGLEYREPPIRKISAIDPVALSAYTILMCQAIRQYVTYARAAEKRIHTGWGKHDDPR